MSKKNPKLFGKLFKQFRLLAGFETLSQFGKALADYGLVYEDSAFSRWQRGNRIPAKRATLITIIRLLAENQGITTLLEANKLLEAAGQGFLTDKEITQLPKILLEHAPFQTPPDISSFIGRESYIKKIYTALLRGRSILISGPAGIGKTVLAIRLAHKLRQFFPDGVLWSRLDTTSPMSILAKIAYTYGENVNAIKNLEARAEVVRSIMFRKKALLIFDNVQSSDELKSLLPNAPLCSVIVTSRVKKLNIPSEIESVGLDIFTSKETLKLFQNKTSKKWAETNKAVILKVGALLDHLPLAVDIAVSNMSKLPPEQLREFVNMLRKERTRLDVLNFADTILRSSFNSSYQTLVPTHKQLFASLGVFAGIDFSLEAAARAANLDKRITHVWLEDLFDKSMIERSTNGRYRLHPLIKLFAKEKITDNTSYINAIKYYIRYLEELGPRGNMNNYPVIEEELDNILGVYKKCCQLKEWKFLIKIWEYLGIFLWDSGYWNEVGELGKETYKAAKKIKNKKTQAQICIRELSWLYFWQGDLKKSESFAKKGLEIAKNLNNKYLIAYAKKRLGMVFQRNGDYNKAEKTLHEALEVFIKLKKQKHAGDIYLYLGHISRKKGNLDKAKDLYRQALDTALVIRDQEGVPIAYYYLGEIALLKKQYKVAESFFKKGLAIDKEQGRKAGEAWNKWGLGLIDLELGNFRKATQLFLQAKEVFEQLRMTTNVKQVEKDIEKANTEISKIDKIKVFEVS